MIPYQGLDYDERYIYIGARLRSNTLLFEDHSTIQTPKSLNNTSREESSTQRKRKRRNSWDPLMNSLKESAEIIGAEIREATNTFNRVFGTESNREELRNNLFAEMNKVEGLTIRECDKAICKLAQNEELMVIFFKVDEERKLGWVKNMLDDSA
ncbi:hypothetical protein R6Q59_018022 [Mikania micrantha]